MMTGRRVLLRAGQAFAAIAALLIVALVVLVLNPDLLKGLIENRGSAAAGRRLAIGHLQLGLTDGKPEITAKDIRLANADGFAAPTMFQADRVSIEIGWRALLLHGVPIAKLTLEHPRLALERRQGGQANWAFGASGGGGPATLPDIGALIVRDGEVAYHDAVKNVEIRGRLTSRTSAGEVRVGELGAGERGNADRPAAASGGEVLVMIADGRYGKAPIHLEAEGASLLALRDASKPYPVRATAQAGATVARLDGSIVDPFKLKGLNLVLDLRGDDAGDLFPLIGLAVPNTPPYHVKGRLDYRDGRWQYQDFSGTVGASDLTGTISFQPQAGRGLVKATLRSHTLDFSDLGLLVGAPAGDVASPAQRRYAKAYAQRPRVLPNAPLDLERVRSVDADLDFKGDKVKAPGLALTNVRLHLTLRNSLLTLSPLDVSVAGGDLASAITIDARRQPVVTDYDIRLTKFNLAQVFKEGEGEITGRIKLRGTGDTVAKSLGSADGEVSVFMSSGRISHLIVELIGLDVAEALGVAVKGDDLIPISCAVADFPVAAGTMTSRVLVMDTSDSVIYGGGLVNLRDERLQLQIKANSKDWSPLAGQSPINIGGTFRKPSVLPDPAAVAARVGGAVALGTLLSPLASIAAFLNLGGAKDPNCSALLQRAGQIQHQGGAAPTQPRKPAPAPAPSAPRSR